LLAAGSDIKDALRHVAKYKVPDDVTGSPSWHRKQFNDLLAMVRKFGMPSFFLTLTAADKAPSGLQWQEVRSCC
jgi:ATP-dependent DNA helicase PIF1